MFSARLFDLMSQRGARIFFAVEKNSPLHKRLQTGKFRKRIIPLNAFRYLDLPSFIRIRVLVQSKRIRTVHTFKSSDVFFSVLATIGFRAWKISRIHHLQLLPKHSRHDLIHTLIYSRLDKLVTITEQIAEQALRFWPVKPNIVRTIYHGIDHRLYSPSNQNRKQARANLRLPAKGRLIGIVGQICEIKGQKLVLQAFRKIRAHFPDVSLIITGSPAPKSSRYLTDLHLFIEKHNLAGSVHFTGFCSDIPLLMSTLDLMVLGSIEEPFGLVVIEAMAAGCPVIASNAGGVPEIIDDQIDGLLYQAGDSKDLEEKIVTALMLDDNSLKEMKS